MIVLNKIGNILVRILTSSTWVTVQTSHGLGSESLPRIAALSRHLLQQIGTIHSCLLSYSSKKNKKKSIMYYGYEEYHLNWSVCASFGSVKSVT